MQLAAQKEQCHTRYIINYVQLSAKPLLRHPCLPANANLAFGCVVYHAQYNFPKHDNHKCGRALSKVLDIHSYQKEMLTINTDECY